MPEGSQQHDQDFLQKASGSPVLQELFSGSSRLLIQAAFSLFCVYAVVVAFDSLPPRLLDPGWWLTVSTSLVNAVSIPIVGVVMVHLAAALSPYTTLIHQRRQLVSRLAAMASLGFLLMIPLLGLATLRGITNVQASARAQQLGYQASAKKIMQAIDKSATVRELQQNMVAVQGPQISDQDLDQPLPLLKKVQTKIVSQTLSASLAQLPRPDSAAFKGIYLQTLRTTVLALVSSIAFAGVSWDPLKQKTLLQKLLSPEKKSLLNFSGWSRSARQLISKTLTPLLAPFKRTPDQQKRQRFWSQWRDKQKRASATRARELKRNAQMIKKAQRERERQRLLKEKKRRREERGKRPGDQQP